MVPVKCQDMKKESNKTKTIKLSDIASNAERTQLKAQAAKQKISLEKLVKKRILKLKGK